MKIFQGQSEGKTVHKYRWKNLIGITGLVLIVTLSALPLPAFLKNRQLDESIKALEMQRDQLPSLKVQVIDLESRVPKDATQAIGLLDSMLPKVDSMLNLRNLLLAQASATGVCVDQLNTSSIVPLQEGSLHPNESPVLARLDIQLTGKAALNDLLLFVGFLEATGLAYRIGNLKIDTAQTRNDLVSFNLDLNIFFQAEPGLIDLEPQEEEITTSA